MKNIFVCSIIRSFWDFLDFLAVQDISIIHILPFSWSSGAFYVQNLQGSQKGTLDSIPEFDHIFSEEYIGKQIKSRWSWMIQNWGTFSWEKMHSFGLCPKYFPIGFWYICQIEITLDFISCLVGKRSGVWKNRGVWVKYNDFPNTTFFLMELCLNSEILKHQFGRRVVLWKK